MIILSETTDSLQVVLSGSVTANQLQCFASWRDRTSTTFIAGRTVINTNNTTDVNIVSPPSYGQRVVDFFTIFNKDTVSATVTVKLDANGVEYILWKGILNPNERLEYIDAKGFRSTTNIGAEKVQQSVGMIASTELIVKVIEADIINNNATLNTLQDVTGLFFDVVGGNSYYFEIVCVYNAAVTTTGSRWTINCPATTFLNYQSEYTLTATTKTFNSLFAKQMPAASNANSLTLGNVATIWGIIKPSASGVVQVQFASEIAGSAITYKSGFIRYRQIV